MAATDIHPIKVTVNKALDYAKRNKVKIVDGKAVIFKTYSSALNCTVDSVERCFSATRSKYKAKQKRADENLAYHLIQSFDKNIDPRIANEIGRKLAERCFGNFQCLISTHTNTDVTHNHIIINAWDLDGKKYNDCLKTYALIRKASDDICREYGLSVLEHTKDFKLIRYKDENGKTKFFEPTERKNAIVHGKFANANDYRNTKAYEAEQSMKENNCTVIKNDIDKLLPYANSFDDLLDKLRDIGYLIKDRKKNGEWREHISFKAPLQGKYTRDNNIDGDNYTRISLAKRILEYHHTHSEIDEPVIDALPVYHDEDYTYGNIDINDINEEYRKQDSKENGNVVRRSEIEKYIIQDTKMLNDEVDKKFKDAASMPKNNVVHDDSESRYTQYLFDRINANLKTLRFIENRNIVSFSQIYDTVNLLYKKRNMAYLELSQISKMLKKANECVAVIQKYNQLKQDISMNRADKEYNEYELQGDLSLLQTYEDILKRSNMLSEEQQQHFTNNVAKYERSFAALSNGLQSLNQHLHEYDSCVYNLNLIDKNNRHHQLYAEEVKKYYDIKKENSKASNKTKSASYESKDDKQEEEQEQNQEQKGKNYESQITK